MKVVTQCIMGLPYRQIAQLSPPERHCLLRAASILEHLAVKLGEEDDEYTEIRLAEDICRSTGEEGQVAIKYLDGRAKGI